MKQKIIVLGGSFNPPTKAHKAFLLAAMEALGAERGVFVPAPYAYIKRKMNKTPYPSEVVDEKIRLKMLLLMSADDPRLCADDFEYHREGMTYTYQTLEALQEKNPDAEIYLLAGADKLKVIPKWGYCKDLLEKFHIAVTDRDGIDAWAEIEANEKLNAHKDHFHIIPLSDALTGVSATAVREALRANDEDTLGSLLHPEAFNLIRGKKIYTVDSFRGEYFFLSNFFPASFTYRGISYLNAEAAFQAQKCQTEEEKLLFADSSAADAKKAGRTVALRSDWEDVKEALMEEIVREKFLQNPDLVQKLKETYPLDLKEGNDWNDTFWGISSQTGEGKNRLGMILMKIRTELLTYNPDMKNSETFL